MKIVNTLSLCSRLVPVTCNLSSAVLSSNPDELRRLSNTLETAYSNVCSFYHLNGVPFDDSALFPDSKSDVLSEVKYD